MVQWRWLSIYVDRPYGLGICGDRAYGVDTLGGRDERDWTWTCEA